MRVNAELYDHEIRLACAISNIKIAQANKQWIVKLCLFNHINRAMNECA
jgi:hypothetical protein